MFCCCCGTHRRFRVSLLLFKRPDVLALLGIVPRLHTGAAAAQRSHRNLALLLQEGQRLFGLFALLLLPAVLFLHVLDLRLQCAQAVRPFALQLRSVNARCRS